MNGLLPKTTLVLTNTRTQAKYEVRSDESGRFEFVGLPPSDYVLQAALPGFATLRGTVSITGQDVFQEVRLNVGEIEETITVTNAQPGRGRPERESARKRPLARLHQRAGRWHRRSYSASSEDPRRAAAVSPGCQRRAGRRAGAARRNDRHRRDRQGLTGRWRRRIRRSPRPPSTLCASGHSTKRCSTAHPSMS